jgi:hypothetical protein
MHATSIRISKMPFLILTTLLVVLCCSRKQRPNSPTPDP